jgi:tripeptidyl-peptidase I
MLAKDMNNLFAPEAEHVQKALQWLHQGGVPYSSIDVSPDRSYISFSIATTISEHLFSATYFEFTRDKVVALASESIHLPPEICDYVDLILPGVELPAPRAVSLPTKVAPRMTHHKRENSTRSGHVRDKVDCFKYMDPTCVRVLHNMPAFEANETSHPANSLGIFQPAWVTWLAEDLDDFFSHYQPEIIGQRPRMLPINGGYVQTTHKIFPFNLESNLDHEYAMALAHPITITNIQVSRC